MKIKKEYRFNHTIAKIKKPHATKSNNNAVGDAMKKRVSHAKFCLSADIESSLFISDTLATLHSHCDIKICVPAMKSGRYSNNFKKIGKENF